MVRHSPPSGYTLEISTTATSSACLAAAAIYRYCVTLCRAKNVSEIHDREAGGSLVVRLRWQS